jgi:predicted ribosomally synthesized peptide with SipW-like signal peptide
MTKRIILSLAMIALTIAGVTSATVAYFSDTAVRQGNTFSMGTVKVNTAWTSGLPFSFVNLTPGAESVSGVLGVGYGGSIPADLYLGMRGPTSDPDLTPILDYYLEEVTAGGAHVGNVFGWTAANDPYYHWKLVASNLTSGNWKYYRVHIHVHSDAPNDYQGLSAEHQDVIIYAVQHGYPAPSTAPGQY